jgi:anti-sigma regulatory factor (Ser/Thr protein kinase)
MIVQLPGQFDRMTMYSLLAHIATADGKPRDHEVVIDFHTLKFIEPVGVAIIYNIINWLSTNRVTVKLRLPELPNSVSNRNPIKYLDDCGFFKEFLGQKRFKHSSLRPTTIPLRNVAYEESYAWLDDVLIRWLMNELSSHNPTGFANTKICLQEIFNNIEDHSHQKLACVFAQHYPANSEIKLAISDFGVGIPFNIKKLEPSVNDARALELAVKEGYSTKSWPRNRGAGLDILTQLVVNTNRGRIYIHSNYGKLYCFYSNGH